MADVAIFNDIPDYNIKLDFDEMVKIMEKESEIQLDPPKKKQKTLTSTSRPVSLQPSPESSKPLRFPKRAEKRKAAYAARDILRKERELEEQKKKQSKKRKRDQDTNRNEPKTKKQKTRS